MDYITIANRVNAGEALVYGSPEYRFYFGQTTQAQFIKEMAA